MQIYPKFVLMEDKPKAAVIHLEIGQNILTGISFVISMVTAHRQNALTFVCNKVSYFAIQQLAYPLGNFRLGHSPCKNDTFLVNLQIFLFIYSYNDINTQFNVEILNI